MTKISYLVILLLTMVLTVSSAQNLTYKGFLDINTTIKKGHSDFNFGGFDNYVSSQVTDKLSFVGEVIIQPSSAQEFRLDVERIHMSYDFNNYSS